MPSIQSTSDGRGGSLLGQRGDTAGTNTYNPAGESRQLTMRPEDGWISVILMEAWSSWLSSSSVSLTFSVCAEKLKLKLMLVWKRGWFRNFSLTQKSRKVKTSQASETSDRSCPSQPAVLELQTQWADCTRQRPMGLLQSLVAAKPYRLESVTEASRTLKLFAKRAPLNDSPAAFSCNREGHVKCFCLCTL